MNIAGSKCAVVVGLAVLPWMYAFGQVNPNPAQQASAPFGVVRILRISSPRDLLQVQELTLLDAESVSRAPAGGAEAVDLFLPEEAKIQSVVAVGPSNAKRSLVPLPVKGEPGHYSVPLQSSSGRMKLLMNYSLPYRDGFSFHYKFPYAIRELAVMVPPSMRVRSSSLHPIAEQKGYRVFAASQIPAGQELTFEIGGQGVLPPLAARKAPPAVPAEPGGMISSHSSAPAPAPSRTIPRAPRIGWRGWTAFSAGLVLLFVAFLGWLKAGVRSTPGRESLLMLKEEFLALEVAKVRGTVSQEEYSSKREALERALGKSA